MVCLFSTLSSAEMRYNRVDVDTCKFFAEKQINNEYVSFKSYSYLRDGSILLIYKNKNYMGYEIKNTRDIKFKCIPPRLLKYK